jgi:hypothetical protein
MATEKVYPEGIRVFGPRQGAPDFVKGSLVITPNALFAWLKKNEQFLSEYKGDKQITLDLLDGQKGIYVAVNTYKKEGTAQPKDDLPF